MCPTAIEADQRPSFLQQKVMVLWAEDLSAQWFQDDAPLRQCAYRLVQREVATLAGKNGGVLFRVILSKPHGMDRNR